MKTAATEFHPAIIWDDLQSDLIDFDKEERSATFIAIGYDKDGNEYKALALFSCGELERLEDIEAT